MSDELEGLDRGVTLDTADLCQRLGITHLDLSKTVDANDFRVAVLEYRRHLVRLFAEQRGEDVSISFANSSLRIHTHVEHYFHIAKRRAKGEKLIQSSARSFASFDPEHLPQAMHRSFHRHRERATHAALKLHRGSR